MPVLLQVCAVIITIAIATIAIVTVRAMNRFGAATDQFARTAEAVRASITEIQTVTRQFQGLADTFEDLLPPLKRTASQVGVVGDRAARLSNVVLNEVEGPIRTTVAVLAGVRTGTRALFHALRDRWSRPETNGGYSHE